MDEVQLEYPNSTTRQKAKFGSDDKGPYFIVAGERYAAETIVKSGGVVIVNNKQILDKMIEFSIPARPTPKQSTKTFSLSENDLNRLEEAAKKEGRSVSAIIRDLVKKWMDDNGY